MMKSSGNVTSPHSQLSIIPIRLACEMYTYCNILELSRCEQFGGWKKELGKFDDKCFCVGRSYDHKMSHFFFNVEERMRTSAKWTKTKNARARRAKLHILTAYICKLMTFFSIAVVVAWALFINLQYFFGYSSSTWPTLQQAHPHQAHFNFTFPPFWSLTKSVLS